MLHTKSSTFHWIHSEALSHLTIWTAAVSGVNRSSCVSSHDDTAGFFSHPVIVTTNTLTNSHCQKADTMNQRFYSDLCIGESTEFTHTDRAAIRCVRYGDIRSWMIKMCLRSAFTERSLISCYRAHQLQLYQWLQCFLCIQRHNARSTLTTAIALPLAD